MPRVSVVELRDCRSQLNLLAHAQILEKDIGSRCGGHGVCGGDRLRILSSTCALSGVTEAEREHLTPRQVAQGWRLACQCWPEADGATIVCESLATAPGP